LAVVLVGTPPGCLSGSPHNAPIAGNALLTVGGASEKFATAPGYNLYSADDWTNVLDIGQTSLDEQSGITLAHGSGNSQTYAKLQKISEHVYTSEQLS
jgi:hypothetical protein